MRCADAVMLFGRQLVVGCVRTSERLEQAEVPVPSYESSLCAEMSLTNQLTVPMFGPVAACVPRIASESLKKVFSHDRKIGKSKEERQAREIGRLHARIDALMANVPMTSVDKPMEISR